ncbi:MAG: type II toxin-antitoxin system RelB/DinJ family antitoxin [Hungatella sp.]
MATKTANVLARVEPDIKEKAEEIMTQLGIPASVVINMLYKQIIMTKSIPFTLSISSVPTARDEMNTTAFNAMMQKGFDDAKADRSRPAADVFAELRQGI